MLLRVMLALGKTKWKTEAQNKGKCGLDAKIWAVGEGGVVALADRRGSRDGETHRVATVDNTLGRHGAKNDGAYKGKARDRRGKAISTVRPRRDGAFFSGREAGGNRLPENRR